MGCFFKNITSLSHPPSGRHHGYQFFFDGRPCVDESELPLCPDAPDAWPLLCDEDPEF